MNCYMIHNALIKIYNSTSNPKHYIDVKPMEPIDYILSITLSVLIIKLFPAQNIFNIEL